MRICPPLCRSNIPQCERIPDPVKPGAMYILTLSLPTGRGRGNRKSSSYADSGECHLSQYRVSRIREMKNRPQAGKPDTGLQLKRDIQFFRSKDAEAEENAFFRIYV